MPTFVVDGHVCGVCIYKGGYSEKTGSLIKNWDLAVFLMIETLDRSQSPS